MRPRLKTKDIDVIKSLEIPVLDIDVVALGLFQSVDLFQW